MNVNRRFNIFLLAAATVVGASGGCTEKPKIDRTAARRPQPQVRAIWVTRWDYKTQTDIARIMDECRRAGFNTVLFQVRGNGTVMYPSRFEPWAKELGGRDPGFDPLRVATAEAHRRGLALHAWMNVMPGWRGKEPPADPRQLYNARPGWFWHDAAGRRQPLGWYNSVNPCYPEVRRYLADMTAELASRYEIDGLHLDYIRFPNEWNSSYPAGAEVPDYPRDPRTLALFRQETGFTPESNPAAWDAWRSAQVTKLVRDIRATVKRIRPRAVLSAAVGASAGKARDEHFQDTVTWMREGLVDAVYPMNYASNQGLFEQRVSDWAGYAFNGTIVMGVMFDQREPAEVAAMVRATARTGGHVAAFAYNSMFERADGNGRLVRDDQSESRDQLRAALLPIQRLLPQPERRFALQ